MANSYFKFKQFTINQEHAAMKVGTDGVLLGAWAPIGNAQRVLDIGCGTGLISLMAAQRSKANIIGIDVDELAIKDAQRNVNESPWKERVQIIPNSLQEYCLTSNQKFDAIVSNPPFFRNSLKSDDTSRNHARHTDSLSFEDLFEGVQHLLSDEGRFSLIIPSQESKLCLNLAKTLHLYAQRQLLIKPTPRQEAKRTLICFGYTEQKIIEEEIVIEDKGRHQYSDAYKNLTKDFYLKF